MDVNFVKIEGKFEINPIKWFQGRKFTEETVGILFIDDQDMPIVENLKKRGYKVKKVRDIKNVTDSDVKCAQIIFVDYSGVGRNVSPEHQGVGVVNELKIAYGDQKYVVLYTAELSLPTTTTMKSQFDAADARMRKDSDVTDFTEQIRIAIKRKLK